MTRLKIDVLGFVVGLVMCALWGFTLGVVVMYYHFMP